MPDADILETRLKGRTENPRSWLMENEYPGETGAEVVKTLAVEVAAKNELSTENDCLFRPWRILGTASEPLAGEVGQEPGSWLCCFEKSFRERCWMVRDSPRSDDDMSAFRDACRSLTWIQVTTCCSG